MALGLAYLAKGTSRAFELAEKSKKEEEAAELRRAMLEDRISAREAKGTPETPQERERRRAMDREEGRAYAEKLYGTRGVERAGLSEIDRLRDEARSRATQHDAASQAAELANKPEIAARNEAEARRLRALARLDDKDALLSGLGDGRAVTPVTPIEQAPSIPTERPVGEQEPGATQQPVTTVARPQAEPSVSPSRVIGQMRRDLQVANTDVSAKTRLLSSLDSHVDRIANSGWDSILGDIKNAKDDMNEVDESLAPGDPVSPEVEQRRRRLDSSAAIALTRLARTTADRANLVATSDPVRARSEIDLSIQSANELDSLLGGGGAISRVYRERLGAFTALVPAEGRNRPGVESRALLNMAKHMTRDAFDAAVTGDPELKEAWNNTSQVDRASIMAQAGSSIPRPTGLGPESEAAIQNRSDAAYARAQEKIAAGQSTPEREAAVLENLSVSGRNVVNGKNVTLTTAERTAAARAATRLRELGRATPAAQPAPQQDQSILGRAGQVIRAPWNVRAPIPSVSDVTRFVTGR